MTEPHTADIVLSLTGRDRGYLFLVVGERDGKLLLADGRTRGADRPKQKNPKHVSYQGKSDARTRDKLCTSGRLTGSDIRKALALWTGEDDSN